MKTGIVLILLVFGQFAYADDRLCEIVNYGHSGVVREINEYVLEQCQDGDVVRILFTTVGGLRMVDLVGKHCKIGTVYSPWDRVVLCVYKKEAREAIRPSKKEWKQMKKNSK